MNRSNDLPITGLDALTTMGDSCGNPFFKRVLIIYFIFKLLGG